MLIIGIIILICFICLIVWGIIYIIIYIINEKHLQKIRDQVAHEILDGIGLQKEKESVINLNKSLNFVVDMNRCPKCGSVLIAHRQAVYWSRQRQFYGGYLRCSNSPKCKFTKRTY